MDRKAHFKCWNTEALQLVRTKTGVFTNLIKKLFGCSFKKNVLEVKKYLKVEHNKCIDYIRKVIDEPSRDVVITSAGAYGATGERAGPA